MIDSVTGDLLIPAVATPATTPHPPGAVPHRQKTTTNHYLAHPTPPKLHPEASFLLGVPGENETSVERTIRFARELDAFAATFHVFVPFPGIPLEKSLDGGGNGNVRLDDWDVYQLNVAKSYCDIPAERLDQLSKQAYRRFYLRPRYLARMAANMCNPHMRRFAANTVLGRHEGGLVRNMVLGVKSRIGLAK